MRVLNRTGRSAKWLLAGALALALIVTASCGPRTTIPRGWSGPAVAGDKLYVGTMDGRLIGVDLASNQLFMNAKLPENGAAIYASPLALNSVYVGEYVGSGNTAVGKVYSYGVGENQTSVNYPPGNNAIGAIVGGLAAGAPSGQAGSSTIFFGSSDRNAYALNDRLQEQWSFRTGGKIWSTPAVSGGTVYVGSFDRKLYALNAADGTKKWEFKTGGAIMATPVVDGGTVYVGSFDRKLYAVDAGTGTEKWQYQAESWFWAAPAVSGGVVYAVSINGFLHVLDAGTGREMTKLNLGGAVSSPPVLIGNALVMVSEAGIVLTVDVSPQVSNLALKTVTSIGEKVYSSVGAGEGTIYVHTQADKLYAINLATASKTELPTK